MCEAKVNGEILQARNSVKPDYVELDSELKSSGHVP